MIDVDDVSVAFDDVPVLDEVSAQASAGELVGLVGPNGSGKTTLLRTISGALAPTSGHVSVDGENIHALSSRAASQRIAVVPQDTSISFAFDVRQIVSMGRTAHRGRFETTSAADRAAVEDALERTMTAGFADRSIDEISGGERQRVLLARAIAQETPALLLDEPTASLDVNHQIETLQLVRSLVEDGTAAVAAIHDLDLAARYCDSLVLLSDGEVVAAGDPESVLCESAISSTFDVRSAVTTDPVTGTTAVRALEDSDPPRGVRVHVLGAGETTSRTLVELDRAGFDLSVGPVPAGDVAASTASSLGADTVTSTPLAQPSDAQISTARERARTAAVTVLVEGSVDPVITGRISELAGPLVVVAEGPVQQDAGTATSDAVLCDPSDIATACAGVIGDSGGEVATDEDTPPKPTDSVETHEPGPQNR